MNRTAWVAWVGVLASGCATLTAPRTELVSVYSEPTGAEVRLDGRVVGETPVTVELPRRRLDRARIQVEMEGYRPEVCHLDVAPGMGYVVPDVILCALLFPIGCIALIDADGSWNELRQKECTASLRPIRQPERTSQDTPPPPPPMPPLEEGEK